MGLEIPFSTLEGKALAICAFFLVAPFRKCAAQDSARFTADTTPVKFEVHIKKRPTVFVKYGYLVRTAIYVNGAAVTWAETPLDKNKKPLHPRLVVLNIFSRSDDEL